MHPIVGKWIQTLEAAAAEEEQLAADLESDANRYHQTAFGAYISRLRARAHSTRELIQQMRNDPDLR